MEKYRYETNQNIEQITKTALFLSLAAIFQIIQIPLYSFLATDITLGILLISTLYLKPKYYYIVVLIAPFFSFFSYIPIDIIGILILEVVYITFIFTYTKLKEKEFGEVKTFFISSLVTILFLLIANLLIFYPFYFSFNYSYIFSSYEIFSKYLLIVFAITLFTTLIRIILSIIVFKTFDKIFKNVNI